MKEEKPTPIRVAWTESHGQHRRIDEVKRRIEKLRLVRLTIEEKQSSINRSIRQKIKKNVLLESMQCHADMSCTDRNLDAKQFRLLQLHPP